MFVKKISLYVCDFTFYVISCKSHLFEPLFLKGIQIYKDRKLKTHVLSHEKKCYNQHASRNRDLTNSHFMLDSFIQVNYLFNLLNIYGKK